MSFCDRMEYPERDLTNICHTCEADCVKNNLTRVRLGTIKRWFGQEFFLLKGLEKVKTEISLSVLSYNLKRVMNIIGIKELMQYMLV